MSEIQHCPVAVALEHLGKKWTIHLIRDMFRGKIRFSEFLVSNAKLSTKVLSTRLKELEQDGLIEKRYIRENPQLIEYHLTERGMALSRVIVELAIFSIEQYPSEVFSEIPASFDQAIAEAKRRFTVHT